MRSLTKYEIADQLPPAPSSQYGPGMRRGTVQLLRGLITSGQARVWVLWAEDRSARTPQTKAERLARLQWRRCVDVLSEIQRGRVRLFVFATGVGRQAGGDGQMGHTVLPLSYWRQP
jgi:hypothetical protein